jgi:hypothetical protein
MADKAVTIQLPDSIYVALHEVAGASGWSLEEVVLQCIRSGMPPLLSKIPDNFHAELLALNKLDDRALLKVVEGGKEFNDSAEARKADLATMRRVYAYALLRWRGHPLPEPGELLL